jgi:hypothetical protein
MSVRFNASGEYFARTSGLLDYNAAYTWMTWVYFVSGTGGPFINIFGLDDGASFANSDVITVADSGTFPFMLTSNISFSFEEVPGTTVPGNGTWYHLAMVRESVTSLKMYVYGVLEATATGSISGRAAATEMLVGGGYGGTSNPADARFTGIKAFSFAMTQAQIRWEMNQVRPARWTSIYGGWPVPDGANRVNDVFSGSARNWTPNGTLTDEANPVLFQFRPQGSMMGVGL